MTFKTGKQHWNYRHGHKGKVIVSDTYNSWNSMMARCTNSASPSYKRYGGRGINVCDRWLRFEVFLADMGHRPKGKTLDRIDNDGNYWPGNCRWATAREQQRHRSIYYQINGERKTLLDWCDVFGRTKQLVRLRIRRGWSLEKALLTPPLK